jgi:hypothetical protein
MDLVTPKRIQRCVLKPYPAEHEHIKNSKTWKLEWDGGGSAESDTGTRRARLEEMLAVGTTRHTTEVLVCRKTIVLDLVVPQNFPWKEYRHTLQALAINQVELEEPSYFDKAMLRAVQENIRDGRAEEILIDGTEHVNAWFDVENGVLWTSYGAMGVYLQSAINSLKRASSYSLESAVL